MRKLIAGNWKMNGLKAALGEIDRLHALLAARPAHCDIAICPPATLLAALADKVAAGPIKAGAQDCHTGVKGAHTGDISAQMMADAGATYVIVGHSERRADHGETDGLVRRKAEAALAAGLTPIICVGETEAERMNGVALTVVEQQLTGSMPALADGQTLVIAYEPVWAIGTGLTPTTADIAEMHGHIRTFLSARLGAAGSLVQILYGGSMKPDNAAAILAVANVDGGLIGGASLKADDFHAIIAAA